MRDSWGCWVGDSQQSGWSCGFHDGGWSVVNSWGVVVSDWLSVVDGGCWMVNSWSWVNNCWSLSVIYWSWVNNSRCWMVHSWASVVNSQSWVWDADVRFWDGRVWGINCLWVCWHLSQVSVGSQHILVFWCDCWSDDGTTSVIRFDWKGEISWYRLNFLFSRTFKSF